MSIGWLQAQHLGLQGAQRGFERAAGDIARAAVAAPDPATAAAAPPLLPAVVDLLAARHAFSANLAVMRRADDMLGHLLDVLA